MKTLVNKIKNLSVESKATIAYLFCLSMQKVISFLTTPIFTRLLTKEMYGQYTVYEAWVGLLSILLTLNLGYGSFSTAMIKYENDRKGYVSSVEGICTVLSVAFLVLYIPFYSFWNALLDLPTLLVLVMILEIIADNSIRFWAGRKRFEFKYKEVVAVSIIVSITSPIVALVMVSFSQQRGIARIVGSAMVTVVAGGVIYVKNVMSGKKFFCKEYWKYAFGFNVPLLIYYFSQMVFNQSDRIMVGRILGNDKAAVYGIGYSISFFLAFVLNAVNNAYIPWLYKKIKSEEYEDNKNVSFGYALCFSFLLLIVVIFAPELIYILSGNEYMEAVYVVPPVAISLLCLLYVQFLTNIEFYFEKKKGLIISTVVSATLNIVLNFVFIGKFGFITAAYTTLISYVVFVIINYYVVRRMLEKHGTIDNMFACKRNLCLFGCFCVLSVMSVFMYEYILFRCCFAVILVMVIIGFKRRIMRLFKK